MTPSTPPRPAHGLLRRSWKPTAAALAVAIAFALGRWTAAPEQRRPAPRVAEPGARSGEMAEARAPRQPPRAAARAEPLEPQAVAALPEAPVARPVQAPSRAPDGSRTRLGPELERRVDVEARAQLELLRPRVVASCWPAEGLPNGNRTTRVTYNVTFDPSGREVGRGIIEDRKAPAGRFGDCLRRLEGTELSVPPPGTYVTLRLPMTYP